MSYSRWSNSVWYTFWCSTASDKRSEQLFQICDFRSNCYFSYGELKENEHRLKEYAKDNVIFELATSAIKLNRDLSKSTLDNTDDDVVFNEPPLTYEEARNAYTDEEYDELVGYMREFMKDVESDSDLVD